MATGRGHLQATTAARAGVLAIAAAVLSLVLVPPALAQQPQHDRCHKCSLKHERGDSQRNESTIEQRDNEATGGDADANGGDGGNANTGNEQKFNGNAFGFSQVIHEKSQPRFDGSRNHSGGCDRWEHDKRDSSEAEGYGGDTASYSGDAHGGDRGNANARGGDADASNNAAMRQWNSLVSKGGGWS